jgi:hypothetical protein
VKVIGMPLGPGVPSVLVDGLDFNVESYRQLQNFVDATQQYLIDHPKDIQPQPISAALNELDGQALLDMNPGVRFAMWRILSGATLTDALALTKNHADVDPIVVRTVYATVLNQPALLRAGSSGLENQHPDPPSQGKASQWINMFRLG